MVEYRVAGRSSSKKRKQMLIAFFFCIIILIGGGFILYQKMQPSSPVPESIRAQAKFPVYYPDLRKLPGQWSIPEKSFARGVSVVTYVLKTPDGNLNISVQKKPGQFDFSTFYSKNLKDSVQFVTPLGQGAIGTAEGRTIGSLVSADDAWILVSSTSNKINRSDIQLVLTNLAD